MPGKYVLDTHALIWHLEGNPKLGSAAASILLDHSAALILPAIALAEACWIADAGRVSIRSDELLRAIDADPRVTIVPLNRAIIERSLGLVSVGEMHDRQIVATALHLAEQGEAVAIVTKDSNIVASRLVPIVW